LPAPADRHFARPSPKWFALLTLLVGLSIWTYLRPAPARSFSGPTMGTRFVVKLVEPATAPQRLMVADVLDGVDRMASTYRADSHLSRFNRVATTATVAVPSALVEIMRVANEVSQRSGGAFDVTVKPLVDAWGFGPDGRPERAPDAATVQALLARTGWGKVSVVGDEALQKLDPTVTVDLSAVAKGAAVDMVAAMLVGFGIEHFMVEVGGEVRARGTNEAGRPWRIGVESADGTIVHVVNLDGGALATSGDYRNFWVDDGGVRRGHTIDPRTGSPVQHSLRAVSVIAQSCAEADAWATALMVLGPDEGWNMAQREGLTARFSIDDGSGSVTERLTPRFENALIR